MAERPTKRKTIKKEVQDDDRLLSLQRYSPRQKSQPGSVHDGSRQATPAPGSEVFSPQPSGLVPDVLRGSTFGALSAGYQFNRPLPPTLSITRDGDNDSLYTESGSLDSDDGEATPTPNPRYMESEIPPVVIPTGIPATEKEFRQWLDNYNGPWRQLQKKENDALHATNTQLREEIERLKKQDQARGFEYADIRTTAEQVTKDFAATLTLIKEALDKAGVPITMQYDGSLLDRVLSSEVKVQELEKANQRLEEQRQVLEARVSGLTTELTDYRLQQAAESVSLNNKWDKSFGQARLDLAALQAQVQDNEREAIEADENAMTAINSEAQARVDGNKALLNIMDRLADTIQRDFQKIRAEPATTAPVTVPKSGPSSKRPTVPLVPSFPGGDPDGEDPDDGNNGRNGRKPEKGKGRARSRSTSRNRVPKPSAPEHWDGSPGKLDEFVRQLRFYIDHEFWGRLAETTKINTSLTLIRSSRTAGFADEIKARTLQHRDFEDFIADLVHRFGDHHLQARRIGEFQTLTQDRRSVAEYNRKFNELCTQTHYDRTTDFALTKYKVGLNQKWFNEIDHERPLPITLDEWQRTGELLELREEQNAKMRINATGRFSGSYQRPTIAAIQFEKKPDGCMRCGDKHDAKDSKACKWDAKKKCHHCGMKNHLEKACMRRLNGHPRSVQVLSVEADTQPNSSTDSPKA